MAQIITKLFKRPEDVNHAVKELKSKGYHPEVIDTEANVAKHLADAGLSEQALEYYKMGVAIGGKVVKVSAEDAKVSEVNKLLLATGFDEFTKRPDQWSSCPGFNQAQRMSSTNPIDAKMTGDFRKY